MLLLATPSNHGANIAEKGIILAEINLTSPQFNYGSSLRAKPLELAYLGGRTL